MNSPNNNITSFILEKYDRDEVPYEPAEYWYLELYIISLRTVFNQYDNSMYYLVLEYPSYNEHSFNGQINNCIWSTPYVACLFEKPSMKRFKKKKDIFTFYQSTMDEKKNLINKLRENRFYHMGISNYELSEGENYIEYKVSPRQPDKWKCYYIQEYFVTGIDSLGLLNLCDPEGLHSYRYYPLTKIEVSNSSQFFLGKPLASNVAHILNNSFALLKQYINEVDTSKLRYSLNGLLFSIDIIGFTDMYNSIVNEMRSLTESGKDIATDFIASLSSIFVKNLYQNEISQYKIEGDGANGGIHFNDSCSNEESVKKIINATIGIHKDISKLTRPMKKEVKLRCSIVGGDYFFGKMSGLESPSQISGELLIKLSRMDQYLKKIISDKMEAPSDNKWDVLLCIAIDSNMAKEDYISQFGLKHISSVAEFRETVINLDAYQLSILSDCNTP